MKASQSRYQNQLVFSFQLDYSSFSGHFQLPRTNDSKHENNTIYISFSTVNQDTVKIFSKLLVEFQKTHR